VTAAAHVPATLSLDLDDVWAYMRARGASSWEQAPTCLPRAVERLVPVFEAEGLTITVFVVGVDATRAGVREALREFAAAGHEIACHSWRHRGDLATLPAAEVAKDLQRACEALTAVTGDRPLGFRCPSFGASPALMDTLAEQGFLYDASVLPTMLGPALRAYHQLSLRRAGGASTAGGVDLFGPPGAARLPLTPFRWRTAAGPLLELPVTTMPLLRLPMHGTYIQTIGAISTRAAAGYLAAALSLCRLRAVSPSFVLHPTDVLDAEDAPLLSYFPGMRRPWREKVHQMRRALRALTADFSVRPLRDAAEALADVRLPHRTPPGASRRTADRPPATVAPSRERP
jgi:hypothetical protein